MTQNALFPPGSTPPPAMRGSSAGGGGTRAHTPNSTSIGRAVSVRLTIVTNRHRDALMHRPRYTSVEIDRIYALRGWLGSRVVSVLD